MLVVHKVCHTIVNELSFTIAASVEINMDTTIEPARLAENESNNIGNHTNVSSGLMDMPNIANETQTAENVRKMAAAHEIEHRGMLSTSWVPQVACSFLLSWDEVESVKEMAVGNVETEMDGGSDANEEMATST
ncbi:hypothetical protein SCLCIDRAFT_1214759 [Scleroderma citrinum Foug A]|uniref:Uncharacterized protein n=1 Tax=Scleroderma citrinum Foug A TaxID=1036808 RepID=A0A0C3ACN3_9AGAM|nr:hypothetical protein SCLCIDRAFT_1214759 [Scleroderma citrinum Foug A]